MKKHCHPKTVSSNDNFVPNQFHPTNAKARRVGAQRVGARRGGTMRGGSSFFFFFLFRSIFRFFSSLGCFLVDLWPRVAAMDHHNCEFGLLRGHFVRALVANCWTTCSKSKPLLLSKVHVAVEALGYCSPTSHVLTQASNTTGCRWSSTVQGFPRFHKMTPGSPNAQFGWSMAANCGHNSTKRPRSEEKSET